MRLLAIDYGEKRIGIAVSDELGLTARPVETIRRVSVERDISRLKTLVDELHVEAVVLGLPLSMDGQAREAATTVLRFADRLRGRLGVPVHLQDERLTSYEAEQLMSEAGLRRKERESRSDQFAAMVIMRDYLATRGIENPDSATAQCEQSTE